MDGPETRRRLLRYAGAGLATGLAGCNRSGVTRRDPNDPVPGKNGTATPPNGTDDEPDGPEHDMPETPPAQFKGEHAEFPHWRMPELLELSDPTDLSEFGTVEGMHPDNRVFDLEVRDETTVHLTISEVIVDRPLHLTLHVRDANDTFQERTATIETTDDSWTTVEHDFDLSGIDLPRVKGGFLELVSEDSHPGNPYQRLAKRHQFVGIPHNNGLEWLNSPSFNYKRITNEDGITIDEAPRGVLKNGDWATRREEPAGAIKTIDGNNQRAVLMAVRTPVNGEVYGVSCHIDHDAYNRYKTGDSRYKYRYGYTYECKFATEISHLRELASKTDSAMNKMHLTTSTERLQVLGDLVQMLPYTFGTPKSNITTNLYECHGNCSDKSFILTGILQNDPWNQMHSFIDCEINGTRHFVVGVDVRELDGAFDPEKAFLVEPTARQKADGYPDTRYAFFDMTYDAYIGQRTDNVEGYGDDPIDIYDEADFSHTSSRAAADPPTY